MTRARAEEDPDVAWRRLAHHARRFVADAVFLENARDLSRDAGGAGFGIRPDGDAQHGACRTMARLAASRERRRKTIATVVFEIVGPRGVLPHFAKQIVDEREQLRHGAEAARDGAAGVRFRPEAVDEHAGLLQDGNVGVAEAVDRLLAIADDED